MEQILFFLECTIYGISFKNFKTLENIVIFEDDEDDDDEDFDFDFGTPLC